MIKSKVRHSLCTYEELKHIPTKFFYKATIVAYTFDLDDLNTIVENDIFADLEDIIYGDFTYFNEDVHVGFHFMNENVLVNETPQYFIVWLFCFALIEIKIQQH